MAQEELQVAIDKAHWPKNVLRVLMPALRKLGDSHGHIIVAPQPARGIIHLQGAAKHIEAAKPGLRALIEEHFPEADIPKELLKPSELPEAPEAPEMGSEPEKSAEQMEKEAPKEVDSPQVLATKALKRAYATHSASAMRIALGAAYSAGVGQAALEEGERWLKELTAAAALGVVLQKDASIQELQAALMAAREACVDEARLEEAELQLGRLETQEALVKAMGGSEAELREALAAARACGSDVDILAEAEARLCTLAAETELLSAMELVQSLEMSGADFDLALALKQQEAAVGDRVQKVKEKCQATPDDFAQLEEVRRQKLEAVEKEDYDRAMELKELEKQLQNRRQLEEVHAIAAAARLLSDSRPEDLLPGLLPTLADQAKAAPELLIRSSVAAKEFVPFVLPQEQDPPPEVDGSDHSVDSLGDENREQNDHCDLKSNVSCTSTARRTPNKAAPWYEHGG
eukprot:g13227.t1